MPRPAADVLIRLVAWRLLTASMVLGCLYVAVFLAIHALPGGPWDTSRPLPQPVLANVQRYYGLDEPIWTQLISQLWAILTRFDFGPAYRSPDATVKEIVGSAVGVSLQLALAAMTLAIGGGLLLGATSALNVGRPVDRIASALIATALAVPEYVSTPLLVLLFASGLHLVPAAGWAGLASSGALVPVLALLARPASSIAQVTRLLILEEAAAPYLGTAQAKGLSARAQIWVHLFPNVASGIAATAGLQFSLVVAGALYVESAYGVPGLGSLFVASVQNRDYPVVMGATLAIGALVIVANLIADVVASALDPRSRGWPSGQA